MRRGIESVIRATRAIMTDVNHAERYPPLYRKTRATAITTKSTHSNTVRITVRRSVLYSKLRFIVAGI